MRPFGQTGHSVSLAAVQSSTVQCSAEMRFILTVTINYYGVNVEFSEDTRHLLIRVPLQGVVGHHHNPVTDDGELSGLAEDGVAVLRQPAKVVTVNARKSLENYNLL